VLFFNFLMRVPISDLSVGVQKCHFNTFCQVVLKSGRATGRCRELFNQLVSQSCKILLKALQISRLLPSLLPLIFSTFIADFLHFLLPQKQTVFELFHSFLTELVIKSNLFLKYSSSASNYAGCLKICLWSSL